MGRASGSAYEKFQAESRSEVKYHFLLLVMAPIPHRVDAVNHRNPKFYKQKAVQLQPWAALDPCPQGEKWTANFAHGP